MDVVQYAWVCRGALEQTGGRIIALVHRAGPAERRMMYENRRSVPVLRSIVNSVAQCTALLFGLNCSALCCIASPCNPRVTHVQSEGGWLARASWLVHGLCFLCM